MENKGQITVFLSLLCASLLILFTAAVGITKYEMNKARVSEVSDGVCESIKADYNTYLFEKYHLLLLDKTYGGKGEAYLEEVATEYMEYTMSDQGLTVSDVALTTYASIMDEDCEELKAQINDYMPEYLAAVAVETVVDKLTSDDTAESISDAISSEVSQAEAEEAVSGESGSDGSTDDSSSGDGSDSTDSDSEEDSTSKTDIRTTLKNIINGGLLAVVTPAGSSVSTEDIDTTDLPSASLSSSSDDDDDEVDTTFDNLEKLEDDLATMSSLTDAIESTNVYGVEYAMAFFNNFTDEKNSDAVLSCEVEYLIAGKTNDQDNLAAVVNRIVLHRLPINMAVLLSDSTKMTAVTELAAALSSTTAGVTYVVIKYLLVACWAYGETLVEIRALLSGNSIQLVKTKENWSLDLDGFANLATTGLPNYEGTGSINYETFLRLFLYEKQSKIYYRMCDLMQTNARQTVDEFRMSNCIYAFSLDLSVSDGSYNYNIKAVTGY